MSTVSLCMQCRQLAHDLHRAVRQAERARRDNQPPDLTRIDDLKQRLAGAPCGCWARRSVLPPPGPMQPAPLPAPVRRQQPKPKSRRRQPRPPRQIPAPDVLVGAISTALQPLELDVNGPAPVQTARFTSPSNPSCRECGVTPPGRPRQDGQPRRHRIRADDPTAPWCTG